MAMVISPRSKVVTLTLLISIIVIIALAVVGVMSMLDEDKMSMDNNRLSNVAGSVDSKMLSSRLQQFTSYTATNKLVSVIVCLDVWYMWEKRFYAFIIHIYSDLGSRSAYTSKSWKSIGYICMYTLR